MIGLYYTGSNGTLSEAEFGSRFGHSINKQPKSFDPHTEAALYDYMISRDTSLANADTSITYDKYVRSQINIIPFIIKADLDLLQCARVNDLAGVNSALSRGAYDYLADKDYLIQSAMTNMIIDLIESQQFSNLMELVILQSSDRDTSFDLRSCIVAAAPFPEGFDKEKLYQTLKELFLNRDVSVRYRDEAIWSIGELAARDPFFKEKRIDFIPETVKVVLAEQDPASEEKHVFVHRLLWLLGHMEAFNVLATLARDPNLKQEYQALARQRIDEEAGQKSQ